MKSCALLPLSLLCLSIVQADLSAEPRRVPFADPFILYYDGMYYAYGTDSPNGIAVMSSKDLKVWTRGVGRSKEKLALHKDDSYGERWFWAPEVYEVKGKFHMYYSADEHVCVAVADHPLGPFVQPDKKPFFPNEKTIDNTLFIDDDGKPYMFFDRFFNGLQIWSVELEDDLLHAKPESYRYCIRAYQPWECKAGSVNEGCFVMKYKGRYYMTYSGNGYTSQDYGIGCAVADNIGGLWKKYDHNPILQKCGGLVGVGHHSFFKDKDGKLRIVFHAHHTTTKIHPRDMYIGTAWFKEEDGKIPELVISQEFITPVIGE